MPGAALIGPYVTQGWYWPAVGPQMTMYIPGPFLLEGDNELILLEVEGAPSKPTGETDRRRKRQTHVSCLQPVSRTAYHSVIPGSKSPFVSALF